MNIDVIISALTKLSDEYDTLRKEAEAKHVSDMYLYKRNAINEAVNVVRNLTSIHDKNNG